MAITLDGTLGITSPAETVQGALTTTGNTILGDSSADTLNVGNGGLVKDASGNVGIGTASPQSLLDLTGNDPTLRFTDNTGSPTATWSLRSNDANFSVRSVTAGADRLVIDSSGNVGIGTASPASYGKLVSLGADNATTFAAVGATNMLRVQGYNSTYVGTVLEAVNLAQSANTPLFINASQTQFGISGTERMRIDSSGNLLVGTTSNTNSAKIALTHTSLSSNGLVISDTRTSGGGVQVYFVYNGSNVGAIQTTSSATSYNTSSDYRLKNTIAPMTGALEKVAALKPVTYKWNVDGSDGQGFIAHELDAVVPGCVTGEKDATREEEYEVSPTVPAVVDADGVETTPAVQAVKGTRTVPSYQGIDTSFLVATLTAAIQEQQALIIQLQADVATLKALSA